MSAPLAAVDAMGCLTLDPDQRYACTAEFGHDGDHTAHGPQGEVVHVWPRRSTDRDAGDASPHPARTATRVAA